MIKRWGWALIVPCLLLGAWKAAAQGGSDAEADLKIDWCLVQNQAGWLGEQFPAPGVYEVEVPTFEGADFSSLPDDLAAITLDDVLDLQTGSTRMTVLVHDRGVDCLTGDPPDVVRLWDDKLTMVIYRNANYDMAFYWPNGRILHTTPHWKLLGPFEPGQLIDEHEILAGTLRLFAAGEDGTFLANWYGPEGGLALSIRFTYPEPCVDAPRSAPRVCPAGD
jgi:hypothetical protein